MISKSDSLSGNFPVAGIGCSEPHLPHTMFSEVAWTWPWQMLWPHGRRTGTESFEWQLTHVRALEIFSIQMKKEEAFFFNKYLVFNV